jgi:hypothetical protein
MERLTKTIAWTMLLCMAFTLARSIMRDDVAECDDKMNPCGYEMCWTEDDCTASGIEVNN